MDKLLKRPNELEESEPHMSNCDGSIDGGFEENLKTQKFYGQHAAWDFCGCAWYDGKKFHEEVWMYHSHVDTISADTLQELMESVNDEYGYE